MNEQELKPLTEEEIREMKEVLPDIYRDHPWTIGAVYQLIAEVRQSRQRLDITFIRDIEESHFRTQDDTGAHLNVLMIWNMVRHHVGLERIALRDLPAYCNNCCKYHAENQHSAPVEKESK